MQYSPPLSPYTSALHDYPPTNIVPQRSPTVLRPLSSTFSELCLYELDRKYLALPDDIVDESTFGMPTQAVRPYIDRTHSADDSAQVPSLIHSPSSSYGTTVSHFEASRPLPRKHSCPTSKGIDLVLPVSTSALQPLTTRPGASGEPRRSSVPINCSPRQHRASQY